MGKGNKKVVSGHTHTQSQLNDYSNQNNPNSIAYTASNNNHANQCNPNHSTKMGR